PAVITRAALELARIPFLIVDAGAKVKPQVPYTSFNLESGGNIAKEDATSVRLAEQAFEYGMSFGKQLSGFTDLLVLGESIPGGTTTALALLTALGIDARFKVSSSMPDNPHSTKNGVLAMALQRAGVGSRGSVFDMISCFGDPMIPSVAGMAEGAISSGCKVLLAGGTQMAAPLAVLRRLGYPLKGIYVGTTSLVAKDNSADLIGLISLVAPDVPLLACDLHLDESSKPGLRAYANGFVKEGVGAGGTAIAAILKRNGAIGGVDILRAAEKEYEKNIESTPREGQVERSVG
ncbi:MAG TPA: TIGR00303 family protein, partial [Nitrososphaera sp.]|nr:TIGR00303 family protein [Nitrososphaera sp.]